MRRPQPNRSSLRFALLPVLIPCLVACNGGPQEVLPISRAIIGSSRIETVELVLQPAASATIALLDERARRSGEAGAAGQPFRPLLEAAVREAFTRAGLTSGRPLRLVLDIDALQVQSTGAALFGRADRLAGTVYLRDSVSGALLGQLYIDVGGANAGPVGLALRGGGVRERLVETFAEQVAAVLSTRRPAR